MTEDSAVLRQRLRNLGLSDSVIDAVWPRWWSAEADESVSARTQLHFSVARRLGLDPRSLLEAEEKPRFIWREEARFKHLSGGEDELEQAGITSFGRSVSSALLGATAEPAGSLAGLSAGQLRESILSSKPYIGLLELLSLAWGFGVPVAHLRVFPWPQKRMAAMTSRLNDRWAVLLAREAPYPPQIAFYLAHEIGHIALGHVPDNGQIVDLEFEVLSPADDKEEQAADAFALVLLTGEPRLQVEPRWEGFASSSELARVATGSAEELQIDPGMIAMLYGHTTSDWQLAQAALRHIYGEPRPVWQLVNEIARRQIDPEDASAESRDFLDAVLAWDGDPDGRS